MVKKRNNKRWVIICDGRVCVGSVCCVKCWGLLFTWQSFTFVANIHVGLCVRVTHINRVESGSDVKKTAWPRVRYKINCVNRQQVFLSPRRNILYKLTCLTKWWTSPRPRGFWGCSFQTQSWITCNKLTCLPVECGKQTGVFGAFRKLSQRH